MHGCVITKRRSYTLQLNKFIHLFICSSCFVIIKILSQSLDLESVPGKLNVRQKYHLDGVLVYHREQTFTHSCRPRGNFVYPILLSAWSTEEENKRTQRKTTWIWGELCTKYNLILGLWTGDLGFLRQQVTDWDTNQGLFLCLAQFKGEALHPHDPDLDEVLTEREWEHIYISTSGGHQL